MYIIANYSLQCSGMQDVSFMLYLQAMKKDEKGQGLVEYALIVVLIAVAAIVAMKLLGGSINTQFSKVAVTVGAP